VNYDIVDGRYVIHHKDKIVRTKNFLIFFANKWEFVKAIELVLPAHLHPNKRHNSSRGLEDCRLFIVDDTLWFNCVSWEYHEIDGPQMCLCSISLEKIFPKIEKINKKIFVKQIDTIHPIMSPKSNQCEKNWLPFIDDTVNFIYDSGPNTTILSLPELDEPLTLVNPLIKSCELPKCNLIDFRGSASPVWVPIKGCWLYVVHEVLPVNGPRKYVHRFVTMNKNYEITGFTKPFYFTKLEIEYVCGMVIRDKTIVLTLGRMDREAYILSLSLHKILSLVDYTI